MGAAGHPVSSITLPFADAAVSWNPVGQGIAAGASNSWAATPRGLVTMFDAESGQVHWQTTDGWDALNLMVSRDGRWIAVVEALMWPSGHYYEWAARARVLSADTGAERCRTPPQELPSPLTGNMSGGVAFSPDNRSVAAYWRFRLATAYPPSRGDRGKVLVFNAESGQPRSQLVGERCVWGLSFSSDSQRVAAACSDGPVVFDAMTGAVLPRPSFTDEVLSVASSPSGNRVVAGCADGTLRVFESETGQTVSVAQFGAPHSLVWSVAFSPDGQWVAGTASSLVGVFRVSDGSPRFLPLVGLPGEAERVIFSPDRAHIAVSHDLPGYKHELSVLDAATGVRVWRESVRSKVRQIEYSPDGRWIAASCRDENSFRGVVRVYNVSLERSRRLHAERVSRVALSPAGVGLVATASGKMATIFHADSVDLLLERSHPGVLTAIAFSPDGGQFVTGSTSGARLFQTVSGERVWLLEHGTVNAVAISPGTGEWVATASNDRNARLVRRDNGEERWRQPHPSGVSHIAFSADAQWVATGAGRVTRILEAADGKERHRVEQDDRVQALAFSPVGSLLATANQDGTVHVIDASTGALRGPIAHPQAVTAVAFSPDGSLLATGGTDCTVRVFSLAEDPPVLLQQLAYDSPVSLVAFQPVGGGLAIVTEAPPVRIVDPETGEERQHLNHSAAVHHLAFGAAGDLLATGCDDKTARVYAVGPP